jgi:hypothetical protein
MEAMDFPQLFSATVLRQLLPAQRSDQFFEALYGGLEEGAFDIRLVFQDFEPAGRRLVFELELLERPGKCLACNLTYGLPQVFSRHPVLNLKGIVQEIDTLLAGRAKCASWSLGRTITRSNSLHTIPFYIILE